MGRLCPPAHMRLRQALPGPLDLSFAGAEANVAASIAMLGGEARFVTALPRNDLTLACLDKLRGLGIDTSSVILTNSGRLGLYFVETGANQRPGRVTYDRQGSSISQTPAEAYDWETAFAGAGWFHFTGITPALSQAAAEATLAAAQMATSQGLMVSCDLNFRRKLWQWGPEPPKALAERVMRTLLPLVNVIIANEEDAGAVLGIHAPDTDLHSGRIDAAKYQGVAQQFPKVEAVAITLRESISASHNNWGSMLYLPRSGEFHFAPVEASGQYAPYEIRHIIDRVGAGDSFGAGLIFAFTDETLSSDPAACLRFATASSCLAHSVYGDFNYHTRAEVEDFLEAGGSGRVQR